MNAYMNITVRVVSAQALAAMKAVEGELDKVTVAQARANAAGKAAAKGGFATAPLVRYGNQMQWLGRQIQYNFTLPIVLAGAAATKWALDNEKATTRITKVYGDLSMSVHQVKSEVTALGKAFRVMSDYYGVAQKDVLNIAADWAAAGSTGVALAKSVDLTMKTIVLGEMSAADATKALIAIQAQYQFSTDDMIDTINQLNIIENQTGISLAGLVTGFEKAAGVAKTAGIDVSHLGAMLAALSPAAGTAAQAGNGLKTIISRLMSPTKGAAEVMGMMGIQVDKLSWTTLTGTQRMEEFAKKFGDLDQSQKIAVASTMASRFQINRFTTAMDEIGSSTGFYAKALDSTADKTLYFKQAQKELNYVLESNPQKFKQIWVMLQNAMAEVIIPLIPYILAFADAMKNLVVQFEKLPPEVKKVVTYFLLFLAIFGPLLRYIGTTLALVRVLGGVFMWVGGAVVRFATFIWGLIGSLGSLVKFLGARLVPALMGPWGIAFAAIIALGLIFHKQLAQIWDAIVKYAISAFNQLPQGIQNAMMAVVNVVYNAVHAVYELFSYLNPFATHSPSLVQNVTKGMAEINKQFATVTQIRGPISQAYADIKRFSEATASFRKGMDTISRAKDLKTILKVDPGAADEFKALVADLQQLEKVLTRIQAAVDKQQTVVDKWTAKLKAADAELDKQKDRLDTLQKKADEYSTALDKAQANLDKYANAPIQGMKAMSDQIFANDQAQKKLQLQMMQMEDVVGPIDDLRNKLAGLQGDIENLRGEQSALRAAGAGGDILSQYDDQINALEDQKAAINQTLAPINDMQKQLDALARTGQELDLQNSIQFDPLTRQIDDLAHGMQELPFDTIIQGITTSKVEVDKYTVALDKANAAVDTQQKAVDAAQASRDKISASLDTESAKLDVLKGKYDAVNQAIQDVNSSLSDMVQMAEDKVSAKAAAAQKAAAKTKATQDAINFAQAKGGDFPVPGGTGKIGREGTLADQSKQIDAWTKQKEDELSNMVGSFDIFGPVKKKWDQFTTWAKGEIDKISSWWTGIKLDINTGPVGGKIQEVWDKLQSFGDFLWRIFGKDLQRIWDQLGQKAKQAMDVLGPEIKGILDLLGPMIKAFIDFNMKVFKPAIEILGAFVIGVLKVVVNILSHVVGPMLDAFISVLGDILQAVKGVMEVITGMLTGDWAMLGQGVKDIFLGITEGIAQIFEGFGSILWGIIQSIVDGIVGIFKWLWNKLTGHSIIPDMLQDIVDWFTGLPARLWDALKELTSKVIDRFTSLATSIGTWFVNTGTDFWNWFSSLPGKAWDALKELKNKVIDKFTDVWNGWVTWRDNFYTKFWNWFSSLPGAAWDALVDLKDKIVDRFSKMGTAIHDWLTADDGFVQKTIDVFTGLPNKIWNGMKDNINFLLRKLTDAFNFIGKIAIAGVNLAIDAINGLIGALNWVANKVPGIDFEIKSISQLVYAPNAAPQLASGGIIPKSGVGGGFATNRARAIVGEGGSYPEFVIPSDPKHRKNALSLMEQAQKTMGLKNAGGPLDFAKGIVSSLKDDAINIMFAPIKKVAEDAISALPAFMGIRGFAKMFLDKVTGWMTQANKDLTGQWQKPTNLALGLGYGNTYSDGSFHSGVDFPGAIGTAIKAAGSGTLKSSYDISGTSPYNSYPYASYGRLIELQHADGISTLYAHLSERLATDIGSKISAGDVIGKLGEMGNATGPHLHFEVRSGGSPIDPIEFMRKQGVNFDSGGFLNTGLNMTANNTNSPEPVLTPGQWSIVDRATRVSLKLAEQASETGSLGGDTVINIYGNLEFPNITSGTDAEQFLTNLESLAG